MSNPSVYLRSVFFLIALTLSLPALAYDEDYDRYFNAYLEYTTGTQVKEIGAESGGPGGHAAIFIQGLCKDESVKFPRVKVCVPGERQRTPHKGVGISADNQFRNANWIAIPGYEFFMHGDRKPDEKITREVWNRTAKLAVEMGIFDGIEFHPKKFTKVPAAADYTQEVSRLCLATDFALTYGRTMSSHRIPISAKHLPRIADYLNAVNARYLSGKELYYWKALTNNCAHISSKIFALAGIRDPIPAELPLDEQLLNLALPANGLMTVQHASNFRNIDAEHIWRRDSVLREFILIFGELPIGAGSLTKVSPIVSDNEVYSTKVWAVKFLPLPLNKSVSIARAAFLSPRRARYTDLLENLEMWSKRYMSALDSTRDLQKKCRIPECTDFARKYSDVLKREITKTRAMTDDMARIAAGG